MREPTIARLESSFSLLASRGDEMADRFYATLFDSHPDIRGLFPDDLLSQKKMLLAALTMVVQNLRTPSELATPLVEMGKRHVAYGVKSEHYPIVRDTLIATMADMAGKQWNEQLTLDWREAIDFVSEGMLAGHKEVVSGLAS